MGSSPADSRIRMRIPVRRAVSRSSAIVGALALLLSGLPVAHLNAAPALAAGPIRSAACHITDGTFTTCPDGKSEWADVTPRAFPDSNSFLYADQADLDPARQTPTSPVDTFVLMYDECGRTTRLGPNQYVLVSFKTIEVVNGKEAVRNYVVHLFSDSTLIFIEDGVPNPAGRSKEVEGQKGSVGFGISPNCNFNHVIAEYQIDLEAAGGHSYSPDPLFWTSTPPQCQLAPLTPITDPVAQEYEANPNNPPLHLDRVDATLVSGINAFITDVATNMGLNLRITSAFRPTAYQAHLYELRQRKLQLAALSGDDRQACADLEAAVNAEIAR